MLIRTVMAALRRPYTFVVLALLVLIIGLLQLFGHRPISSRKFRYRSSPLLGSTRGYHQTRWQGGSLRFSQRLLTASVNDIEHIESNTYPGVGVVKIFSQPGVDVAVANAQITAASQVALRQMPAGTQTPVILNYNSGVC